MVTIGVVAGVSPVLMLGSFQVESWFLAKVVGKLDLFPARQP